MSTREVLLFSIGSIILLCAWGFGMVAMLRFNDRCSQISRALPEEKRREMFPLFRHRFVRAATPAVFGLLLFETTLKRIPFAPIFFVCRVGEVYLIAMFLYRLVRSVQLLGSLPFSEKESRSYAWLNMLISLGLVGLLAVSFTEWLTGSR